MGAQIVADAAAKAVANAIIPGASIVLKGVRSFGDASQEARKAGASIGQQVTYGGLTAGIEAGTEKWIDGLAEAYGKGLHDEEAEQRLLKYIKGMNPKLAERLVDVSGEAGKTVFNYALETPLKSIYNDEENPFDNYHMDAFSDALRDAGINAALSGVISAYADAKRAASQHAEGYAALTKANNKQKSR